MSERWDWKAEREIESRAGAHLPFLEEVLEQISQLGWEGRDYFGVQMTLEETLTNAIRHGNGSDAAKLVRVECKASDERFWLRVGDEGQGFRPDHVPDCTKDENLESFGGRGMALIYAYMAGVSFNDCGNEITVHTHRGFRPPADDE